MIGSLIGVLGFYLIMCLAVSIFQRRLIYFPTQEMYPTHVREGLELQDVWLESEGENIPKARIHGWYVPSDRDRGALLICHGNGGNIADRIETIELFHGLGLNVFIIDYRGYGKSEGKPSEKGLYADALTAWNYLTGERGFEPRRIVILGRSLGGGVASWLATRVEPGTVILESTFTSLSDMGADLYPYLPARLLVRDRFATIDRIAKIEAPLLIGHSPHDDTVPYKNGQALFSAAAEPKEFLEMSGDHNSGFSEMGQAYIDGVDAFLRKHFDRERPLAEP